MLPSSTSASIDFQKLFGDDDDSESESDSDNDNDESKSIKKGSPSCSLVASESIVEPDDSVRPFKKSRADCALGGALDSNADNSATATATATATASASLPDFEDWRNAIGIFENVLTRDKCDELIAIHESEAHHGYIDHLTVTRVSDLATNPEARHLLLPLLNARFVVWQRVAKHYRERRGSQSQSQSQLQSQSRPPLEASLLPEFTALTAWHEGSFLRNHYDANRDYLADRFVSAVLYLNDPITETTSPDCHPDNYHRRGFDGGTLVFEVPQTTPKTQSTQSTQPSSGSTAHCHSHCHCHCHCYCHCHCHSHTADTRPEVITVVPGAGRLVCFPSSSDYVHRVEKITSGTRYALVMWFARGGDNHNHNPTAVEHLHSLWQPHVLPQPWESPAQATALRERCLLRAGLVTLGGSHAMFSSLAGIDPTTGGGSEGAAPAEATKAPLSETEWRHLAAHCWWKTGRPLGDIATRVCASGPAARYEYECYEYEYYERWKTGHVRPRLKGLASAMARWDHAEPRFVTSVTEAELEVGPCAFGEVRRSDQERSDFCGGRKQSRSHP